jgi:hypothetical protein
MVSLDTPSFTASSSAVSSAFVISSPLCYTQHTKQEMSLKMTKNRFKTFEENKKAPA